MQRFYQLLSPGPSEANQGVLLSNNQLIALLLMASARQLTKSTYIFFFAQFSITMGEVAGLSFCTVFALLEMLAQLSLKQIVELLSLWVLRLALLSRRVVRSLIGLGSPGGMIL
jgi:hypothetical protein